jgi:hypothetical protein
MVSSQTPRLSLRRRASLFEHLSCAPVRTTTKVVRCALRIISAPVRTQRLKRVRCAVGSKKQLVRFRVGVTSGNQEFESTGS